MSSHLLFEHPEVLKDFYCAYCEQLLNNPVQPNCGHRLCKSCADQIIRNFSSPRCPKEECKENFLFLTNGKYYFLDRYVKREIQALQVQCRRCNWKGTYGESHLHFPDCKHVCRFCGAKMSYYDFDRHTASCEDYQSNFERVLRYGQQETESDSLRRNLMMQEHIMLEVFSERELMAEVRARNEEIEHLKSTVTKSSRSQNAEIEDHVFRLSLIENSNHDGSMIWKISQFSQRKADAENGKYISIFSLPFYSGRYGYKMCLRLYIMGDGIGKGTHLSLFFVVMRGEFDNILQWPFTHKITFKLFNQARGRDIVDTFQPDPTSSSFRKPKSDMNIASGCPRFISHTKLERGGFIVDDTIFIKCMIDTSTIHHP